MTWATPSLAALVATVFLTGCCVDRSLIKNSMSDQQINRIAADQFEGENAIANRLQIAARMVDWKATRRHSDDPVVLWDAEQNQMAIPVVSGCYLGITFSNREAVFEFDNSGVFQSAHRRYTQSRRSYPPGYRSFDFNFDDPWSDQETHRSVLSFTRETEQVHHALIAVYPPSNGQSRLIDIVYITSADSKDALQTDFKITTDPPLDFVLIDAQGPLIDINPLYGAYIVQNDDFAARSGKWRPYLPIRLTPFPRYSYVYRCRILLEPHDGVVLTIGLDLSENNS